MIAAGRFTAAHEGPVAVFLIGMRVNCVWRVDRWWPVFRAMGAMLRELGADPDSGFLGATFAFVGWRTPLLVQYWRSFEHLHAYAHDPAREHQPAWRRFNRATGGDGTVGIYHETYLADAGRFETIYVDMPPFGLGGATGLVPATGRRTAARDRLATGGQAASAAATVASIQPPPSTRSPA